MYIFILYLFLDGRISRSKQGSGNTLAIRPIPSEGLQSNRSWTWRPDQRLLLFLVKGVLRVKSGNCVCWISKKQNHSRGMVAKNSGIALKQSSKLQQKGTLPTNGWCLVRFFFLCFYCGPWRWHSVTWVGECVYRWRFPCHCDLRHGRGWSGEKTLCISSSRVFWYVWGIFGRGMTFRWGGDGGVWPRGG